MKSLLLFLFILFSFQAWTQNTTEWQYARVNNLNLRFRLSKTYTVDSDKKYPLFIFLHGNGEGGAAGIENTNVLFTAATLGRSLLIPYNASSPLLDSFIIVMIQTAPYPNTTATGYPSGTVPVIDYFDKNYRTDTTRGVLAGFSMGAANIIDLVTTDGVFGGAYNKKLDRFKRLIPVGSPSNRYYNHNRMRGRGFRAFVGSQDWLYTNHIGTVRELIKTGGYGTNTIIKDVGHDNRATDSAFSTRGKDTLTNVYLWGLSTPSYVPDSNSTGGGLKIAGYITLPQGSPNDICKMVNPSLKIFTDNGEVGNGKVVTDNIGIPYNGKWNWFGYKITDKDTVTHYIQITSGGTIQNYTICNRATLPPDPNPGVEYVLAGYINEKDAHGYWNTCAVDTGINVPVYTKTGAIVAGEKIYADRNGTLKPKWWDYGSHAYSKEKNGVVLQAIRIFADGLIKETDTCNGR